jgi:hypothetical protein
MFDLTDAARLWIPVKWPGLMPGPDESVAVEVEHEIEIEVEIVDREELLRLFPLRPERANTPDEEVVIFKRLCSSWRKFKIAGQTAEFSDENIKKLCSVPMFATGFELAYMAAWQGRGAAREKNSESSPSIGRAGIVQGAKGTTSSSAIAADSE